MCPALLYQIERRLCIVHYDELEDFTKSKNASIENNDKTGASGRCVTSKAFKIILHCKYKLQSHSSLVGGVTASPR